VRVAAIISVPQSNAVSSGNAGDVIPGPIVSWDVLGQSILSRVVDRLRVFGVSEISVLPDETMPWPADEAQKASAAWESTVARYLGYGLKTLLLLRMGAYVEFDVTDFLRFHGETSKAVTRVCGQHQAHDVFAIEASRLQACLVPVLQNEASSRYPLSGYSNPLHDVRDFRQMVRDALWGRAAIRPIGKEIAANIWVDDGARVDSTRVRGPAYIGRDSRVHSECAISGSTSVERQCEIDYGTSIDDCSILPRTYVGMGLSVRNAVASEDRLFHLRRNVQLHFHDRRLMGAVAMEHGLQRYSRALMGSFPGE